jgi:anaerobic C4-dicarboxylate transporter
MKKGVMNMLSELRTITVKRIVVYLKQVVQEMIVSQGGVILLACKNWDGNSAETKVFKKCAKALVKMVKTAPKLNYLVADCKLYHKDNADFYLN